MASGKQKREFSPGTMSLMLTPGLGDSILIEGNFEGFASGLRLVLGTKAFVGGKQGTFSLCGAAYLDGGDTNNATGTCTYENVGKHRQRIR